MRGHSSAATADARNYEDLYDMPVLHVQHGRCPYDTEKKKQETRATDTLRKKVQRMEEVFSSVEEWEL